MAQGDLKLFNTFPEQVSKKVHDLENDVFKMALVSNTTSPTAVTADPRFGAGGSTNFAANEVSGTNYTPGGIDIQLTVSRSANVVTIDGALNPAWVQHASGPSGIRWGIIYNDTSAGKEAIGWVDWGEDISLVDGPISYTFHPDGIATFTLAA